MIGGAVEMARGALGKTAGTMGMAGGAVDISGRAMAITGGSVGMAGGAVEMARIAVGKAGGAVGSPGDGEGITGGAVGKSGGEVGMARGAVGKSGGAVGEFLMGGSGGAGWVRCRLIQLHCCSLGPTPTLGNSPVRIPVLPGQLPSTLGISSCQQCCLVSRTSWHAGGTTS